MFDFGWVSNYLPYYATYSGYYNMPMEYNGPKGHKGGMIVDVNLVLVQNPQVPRNEPTRPNLVLR